MAFQPKGSGQVQGQVDSHSLNSLVDQITSAVRQKLIAQGVPLPSAEQAGAPGVSQNLSSKSAGWKSLVHQGADRIGHSGEGPFQPHLLSGDEGLASRIDHTLLKPDATREEIERLCEEARKYHFATVCVNSSNIALTAQLLKGSSVKPIAVVGFPLGAAATATKAFEAREAIRNGAQEIDMVIHIGALKSRDYTLVLEDIRKVVEASQPAPVKVILETANLNNDEKIIGCALAKAAGAAFVKTSTGFGAGGATEEDIALMRRIVGPEMGVKASGGIRTYEDATKMIAAGANRIGASASVAIVTRTGGSGSGGTQKGSKNQGSGVKKPYKNSLY